MFKILTIEECLLAEQQKSAALQAQIKELEDALIEVAELAASNEEALQDG